MKKSKLVLISQDQLKHETWAALAQIQQQAKSGLVTVTVGDVDPPVEAVAAADPLRTTIGSLVVEALRAAAASKAVALTINGNQTDAVMGRPVAIFEDVTMADMATATDASAGTTLVGNLTFDNGSKNNDSVSNAVADGTGVSAFINAKLATRKPDYSLASLLNALEDVALAQEVRFVVLFDQADNGANGRVKVFQVDTNDHLEAGYEAARDLSAEYVEFAQDTTPASSAEKLAGE